VSARFGGTTCGGVACRTAAQQKSGAIVAVLEVHRQRRTEGFNPACIVLCGTRTARWVIAIRVDAKGCVHRDRPLQHFRQHKDLGKRAPLTRPAHAAAVAHAVLPWQRLDDQVSWQFAQNQIRIRRTSWTEESDCSNAQLGGANAKLGGRRCGEPVGERSRKRNRREEAVAVAWDVEYL